MPIWYNYATKKKSGRVGSPVLLYGLCIVHSPNFLPKKFLKNSKILLDLVPKRDYIINNKRETEGHTSAQERGTK